MVYPSQYRKPHRLKAYDYASANSYLITFNVLGRKQLLSEIKQEAEYTKPVVSLTAYGRTTEKYILNIPKVYEGVELDNVVIMPDHVHILLTLGWNTEHRYDIATIIRATKRMITNEIGESIWQLDYYDVIADTPLLFERCDKYIDDNPAAWINKHAEPLTPK